MRICHHVVHRHVTTAITIALQAGCLCVAAQEASILIPPRSVNISVNEVAVINCAATATFISWEVNEQPVDDNTRSKGFDDTLPIVTINETQNLRMRALRVLGSSSSNGANITCFAILTSSTNPVARSEPALILVQDLLGPVHNLIVTTINSTTVLISWSPPFTLEGVPILGYNVTITNTTSGESETVSVEDTTLLYSIDHPDPENSYTVTVVPLNEVGAGQPVTSGQFLFPLFVEPRLLSVTHSSLLTHSTLPFSSIEVSQTVFSLRIDLESYTTTSSGTVNTAAPTLSPSTTPVTVSATPVTVVVLAVVTTLTVISSLGLLATTCFFARKHKITRSGTAAQDVVMVSDNPAYQQITVQRIELKENTAYHTVHHPTVSPQYENISQVGVVGEDEVGSKGKESPDYEDVPDL